ncbi:MAG: thioredoxin family protein [Myxococcales bacterium]|nr:thioredoxin family protein [Myxococcales bacterium]
MASSHPHFDDKGLHWHHKLDEALAVAQKEGKHVLVEYGRKACGNCKILVEALLPAVKAEVDAAFVLLATDCDAPEPAVRAIGGQHMSHARALPFVLYLRSDGAFVHGTQGARTKDQLLHDFIHGREDPDHHHHEEHDHGHGHDHGGHGHHH